jgi:predicted RNA-binding protein with PIN domain
LLRPALEAAVVVAQQIDTSAVPAGLRQFLKFTRLPPRALPVTRRALDDDEAFRERVRSVVDEDAVGEAGWLLLDRPDGWESSLRDLVDAAEDEEAELSASAELRRARREIENVRAALERAESDAATAREALDRSRSEVTEQRAARRRAEDEATALARRLDQADGARARAVRELEAARAQATDRANALREADRRARAAEEAVEAATSRAAPVSPGPPPARSTEPEERRSAPVPLDVRALADQIDRASTAAEGLADALASAARLLAADDERPLPPPTRVSSRLARRRPAPLPVGVLDDSPEAARHLLGVKGMTVLVDGYNVSMRGWSELPLALQRDRLVDGLATLAARTGVRPVVVFDASERVAAPSLGRGRAVQVRFAPPGIEADDVIIDAVGDYPVSSPVTVVSSDGRVRDGARRQGANLLATDQLLGLL